MKLLADVNIEKPIIDYLKGIGYDIKWIPDYNCQMKDEDLIDMANREKRILLTNDKDFGGLVFFQKKISPGIILLRIKSQNVDHKIQVLSKLFERYKNKITGNFVVLSKEKIRIILMGDR